MGFNSAFKGLNLSFLDRLSKHNQMPHLMKSRPVGAKVFHADGQTDMRKLRVACHNSANTPKKTLTKTK